MLPSSYGARPAAAVATPSYRVVSPRDRSALTAFCTRPRSLVGATSTPAVPANETSPTATSWGASFRKAAAALRTVAMPASPMDPLVSTTSIVARLRCATGLSVTG